MSCNCKNTQTFKDKLSVANTLTEQTGETHVVFIMEAVKEIFVCKLADITDDFNVLSYFLSDGSELAYTSQKTKDIIATIKSKKNVQTIQETPTDSSQTV